MDRHGSENSAVAERLWDSSDLEFQTMSRTDRILFAIALDIADGVARGVDAISD